MVVLEVVVGAGVVVVVLVLVLVLVLVVVDATHALPLTPSEPPMPPRGGSVDAAAVVDAVGPSSAVTVHRGRGQAAG